MSAKERHISKPVTRTGDLVKIAGSYQADALVSRRPVQRFWHKAKIRIIDKVAPPMSGGRIADVGCGSGVIAGHLGNRGSTVIGIDSNPDAIEFAERQQYAPNVSFVLGQFARLEDLEPFDQIYCLEVLEHLYEPQVKATLSLFHRIAKPRGELFVTTPNYHSAWPVVEWALDRFRLVPHLADDQHVTRLHVKRLARMCRKAGWDVVEAGSFNGLAPFLAPISVRLADKAADFEFRLRRVLPLNLVYCYCRKRDAI